MIEFYENLFQLLCTGLVTVIAAVRAVRSLRREWVLMALFSGVYFMSDLYWILYLLFYHHTLTFSFIPDMGWYAALLFLLLLLIHVQGNEPLLFRSVFVWIIPVFTGGMCLLFMRYGAYLSNLIAAVLMTMLMRRAIGGALRLRGDPEKAHAYRRLYRGALLFCTFEYAMWTVSCFFWGDVWYNPYFWFDALLSVTFVYILAALRKAVDR